MKKITLLLFLICLVGILAGCGADQYTTERDFWYSQKEANNIFQNPLATPPHELDRVIVTLRKFIQKHPDTLLALEQEFVIGRLYLAKQKYDRAREQFNMIIEKYGKNLNIASEAVFLIGNSYEIDDKWKQALEQYRKIMQEYPVTTKGLDVPFYIAKYYEAKYQPEKMLAAYREAVVYYDSLALKYADSQFGYIVANLKGRSYAALKDWESAIGVYNFIVDKYKSKIDVDVTLMNIAIICYQELKDYPRAKQTIERLIEEFPQSKYLKTAAAMLEAISADSK